jgi:hypothetical protein
VSGFLHSWHSVFLHSWHSVFLHSWHTVCPSEAVIFYFLFAPRQKVVTRNAKRSEWIAYVGDFNLRLQLTVVIYLFRSLFLLVSFCLFNSSFAWDSFLQRILWRPLRFMGFRPPFFCVKSMYFIHPFLFVHRWIVLHCLSRLS